MSFVYSTIYATKNPTYKYHETKLKREGILIHSTGADNKNLKRYVQPDDGTLGTNPYGNSMNREDCDYSVHGFIGEDKNGDVKFVKTLPFDQKVWGCGSGRNGSYNSTHIQFEICEGSPNDKEYALASYNVAVDLCVFLCQKYGLEASDITSHYEAHADGYASNHGDPKSYWTRFGLSMDGLRKDVKKKLDGQDGGSTSSQKTLYRVRKSWDDPDSQVSANYNLEYAMDAADDYPGYSVYNEYGKPVYTSRVVGRRSKYTEGLQLSLNASYKAGLVVDRSAGPLTQGVIDKHYLYYKWPTIKNAHVSWLQDALKELGYTITVDGSYGSATEAVVKQFQRDHGLVVDGIAGVKTHMMILSLL